MKILVLMPLDEQHVCAATYLYDRLSDRAKKCTFAAPCYMEYLVENKLVTDWLEALVDASYTIYQILVDPSRFNKGGDFNDDVIIFGNAPKDCGVKFDAIFNFQDIERDEPYKDLFLEKFFALTKDKPEEDLAPFKPYLGNLYTAQDSSMPLHGCTAAANFLSSYLETEPQYDIIKSKYNEQIKLTDEGVLDESEITINRALNKYGQSKRQTNGAK